MTAEERHEILDRAITEIRGRLGALGPLQPMRERSRSAGDVWVEVPFLWDKGIAGDVTALHAALQPILALANHAAACHIVAFVQLSANPDRCVLSIGDCSVALTVRDTPSGRRRYALEYMAQTGGH